MRKATCRILLVKFKGNEKVSLKKKRRFHSVSKCLVVNIRETNYYFVMKLIFHEFHCVVQALMSTNLYNLIKLTLNVHANRNITYYDCNFVTLARPFGVSLTICAIHDCGQVLLRFFLDRSKTCITIHYGSTSAP